MLARNRWINPALIATALLLFAFIIASYNSISVTSFSISDSNPSGYIIVPMLMLLVFIIFSYKEKLSVKYSRRNIAYGAIIAAFYFALYSYAQVSFSYLFGTYRIDALLFPLLLVSFAMLLFGSEGIKKLRTAIIFSIFASPLLLMPLLDLSTQWTYFNAHVVFDVLKILGVPVLNHGIVISSASGSYISIASTCADIGAFVAMALFLIPVAYVYNGSRRSKATWLVSGMVLLFILNIIRMSSIALIWAYYGISNALNTVHLFIGQILFDLTLVIMILLAPKFSMYINGAKSKKSVSKQPSVKNTKALSYGDSIIPIISVFVLAIIVLTFTLPLHSYYYTSPFAFSNNIQNLSNSSVISSYYALVLHSNRSLRSITLEGKSELFGIYKSNDINTTTNSFLFINTTEGPSLPKINKSMLGNVIMHREEASTSGITINAYITRSAGDLFQINYVSIPSKIFGNYTVANMEFVKLINSTQRVSNCQDNYGAIPEVYSYIYNAFHLSFNSSGAGISCAAANMALYYKR